MRGVGVRVLGFVLAGGLFAAACGSDATTTSTGAPPPVSAATGGTEPAGGSDPAGGTDPPAPQPTNAPPGGQSDAEAFFREAIAACNEQSVRDLGYEAFDGAAGDPTIGVTFDNEVSPGVFQIEDSRGITLLVDMNNRQITGTDGPDGILPRDFLFVCPEPYFVGRFDEDGMEDEAAPTEAESFFYEALARCNSFSDENNGFEPFDSSAADPLAGVAPGAEVSPGVFEVVDNDGVRLLLDLNNRVITGPDGPNGVMPRPYAFWCSPELFPGTLDEGGGDEEDEGADPFYLQPDGLGTVDFGSSPETTITIVSNTLGPPDRDSGWVGSFSAWGTCPGAMIRVVGWWNMDVLFTDISDTGTTSGDGPHFFNWRVPDLNRDGVRFEFETRAGIGFGSTVEALQSAYGSDVEVEFDPDFGDWYFNVTGGADEGIYGFVEGSEPTDTITFLEAGALCGD